MPQRATSSSSLMRPFVVLALPGMYLLYKYNQYRQQQMETARRRVTERELMHLNTKIKKVCEEVVEPEPKALPAPEREVHPLPAPRPGVQVSVLGADTPVGQYIALLLKQCPCMRKLRLYEAKESQCSPCTRDLYKVVQDLHHIDTNCLVQAFSCAGHELERCLQNTDIVLILDSGYLNVDMPFEKRFCYQAPIVKKYADAIANECPKAFIICCATPIDCMVPLIAEHNAELMTETVRNAPLSVSRQDGVCTRAAELSEAHALAGLVTKVAWALLCKDVPRVTGFVETDSSQVISPARFIANTVEIWGTGISKWLGLPKMSELEMTYVDLALNDLCLKQEMVGEWYCKYCSSSGRLDASQTHFFTPRTYERFEDCAYATVQDKLLNKLEENEPELATSPEEECVICVNAKATMQTSPCGHRVVCRRCFVKTIQMAVSQRLLPLRCVICRAKILRLRQAPRLVTSKSWQVSSGSGRSWGVPGSVSSYSVGARSVPASASLYSVTSGESSLSGVSSVSSNSGGNVSNNACSTKLCGGAKCGGACLGAVPRVPNSSAPPRPRQPASNTLRRSQHHSMKARLQDYQVHSYTGGPAGGEPSGRLPPIREFQREFREGRRESVASASASTRIRCAQKIVTQLETSPQKNKPHFFRPLKAPNNDDPPKSRDSSKETERKKETPKAKPKKEEKKKKETDDNTKQGEKSKKEESTDNKKNELAEKKKEEKLRLKAEKEAKKEAKQQAKEEERQAKLQAKEEERQAKLLAKEEKKKAKKEAKLAAQAEKEKNK